MLIYLVRHGQTAMNQKSIIQGHLDTPLSHIGEDQAIKLGQWCDLNGLRFDEAYTSDLRRAQKTLQNVLNGGRQGGEEGRKRTKQGVIKVEPRLKARFMGSLQGKVYRTGMSLPEDWETDQEIAHRIGAWFSDLILAHTPPSTPLSSPIKTDHPYPNLNAPTAVGFGTEEEEEGAREMDEEGEKKILVITHQECLTSLLNVLRNSTLPTSTPTSTTSDHPQQELAAVCDPSESSTPPLSPMRETIFPDHLDYERSIGNTAVSVLRVSWDGDEVALPIAKFESWGSIDHLEG